MGEWKSCAGRVYRGAWVTPFPCKKNATIEEGGKWWCKQHAPSLAAERIEKRNAEWRRKREAERAAASRKDAIASAERAVIEAGDKATQGHHLVGWGTEAVHSSWSSQAPKESTIVTAPAPPFAFGKSVAAFDERGNADFYAHAANARSALKAHLAAVARLVEAASKLVRSYDDVIWDDEPPILTKRVDAIRAALKEVTS
jgi:hypothetical protein